MSNQLSGRGEHVLWVSRCVHLFLFSVYVVGGNPSSHESSHTMTLAWQTSSRFVCIIVVVKVLAVTSSKSSQISSS